MEQFRNICGNPWCKVAFFYTEKDMIINPEDLKKKNVKNDDIEKIPPNQCPKCRSFASELSGGVEWRDKKYEGSRFDGMPHQIRYKVTNYRQ